MVPPQNLGGPGKAESLHKNFCTFHYNKVAKTSHHWHGVICGLPQFECSNVTTGTQSCELINSELCVTVWRTHSMRKFHLKMTPDSLCTEFLTKITYAKVCTSPFFGAREEYAPHQFVPPLEASVMNNGTHVCGAFHVNVTAASVTWGCHGLNFLSLLLRFWLRHKSGELRPKAAASLRHLLPFLSPHGHGQNLEEVK